MMMGMVLLMDVILSQIVQLMMKMNVVTVLVMGIWQIA
jgi:hypothetical protein